MFSIARVLPTVTPYASCMSLIFATQLTAVATALLVLFAIVTAVFALLAFCKQSQEVGLLLDQATREAEDRRKAQAAMVFAAVGGRTPDMEGLVRLVNSSGQPIDMTSSPLGVMMRPAVAAPLDAWRRAPV